MNEAIFKDKAVDIMLRDGKKYTILPLTLNQMIDLWPTLVKLENLKDEGQTMDAKAFSAMRNLVAKLLQASGYEKVTEKQAGDLVDLGDIRKLIAIIAGQNPELAKISSKE